MTAHVHTDDCYGEIDGRLVCLRPPQPRPYEGWDMGPPEVAPDLVPRRIDRHADHRPCRHWLLWVALGLAWLIGGLLLAWGASEIARHATPRAAAIPTTLVAARDLSGHLEGASGSPLPGAPPSVGGLLARQDAPDVTSPGPEGMAGGAPQTLDPRVGREGEITHIGDDHPWPEDYLAIPLGPGVQVRICGPAACADMVSTDAGPNRQKLLEGVIADVSWQRFETLCGVPARMGGCPGSWTVIGPRLTLPPTDVAP